jgi:HEAT repeat protein
MMSPLNNLKQWPTSSLVDRFIAILSPFGAMDLGEILPIPGLDNKAKEFNPVNKEARAIATELDRRNDSDAGHRLWSCRNPAVRLALFAFLMPDATGAERSAALLGPLSGLPDETAGELYLRALETHRESVSLQELTEDELVERFVEFGLRDFMGTTFFNLRTDQSQIDARNNVLTELWRVLAALKDRGALGRLLPLLKHENQNVRLWAANGALFVDEDAALAVLTAIAGEGRPTSARLLLPPGPGLTNMSAMDSLKRWRTERRGVYGLNPGDKRF